MSQHTNVEQLGVRGERVVSLRQVHAYNCAPAISLIKDELLRQVLSYLSEAPVTGDDKEHESN